MSNTTTAKIHTVISTVLAASIVAAIALTLDQGHIAAAPRGIVEIGELVPVEQAPQIATLLPEVVVIARAPASALEKAPA